MALSRKHYNKLAKLINDNIVIDDTCYSELHLSLHSGLINQLGIILKQDNNNFDFNKWNNACFKGYEDVVDI